MASDTREKILAAALELFSIRGLAAVGTKAIAEKAGVNEVTLFRLFGSKDKLWVAVFQRYVVKPEPEFLLADATGDLAADLSLASRRMFELLASNTKLVRMNLMGKGQFPEIDDELESQASRALAVLEAYLGPVQGQLTAPAAVVARTLVDTLFGVVLHFEILHRSPVVGSVEGWLGDFLPLFLKGAVVPTRS